MESLWAWLLAPNPASQNKKTASGRFQKAPLQPRLLSSPVFSHFFWFVLFSRIILGLAG